jgi:hypothetical protein
LQAKGCENTASPNEKINKKIRQNLVNKQNGFKAKQKTSTTTKPQKINTQKPYRKNT